jgi:hypothetical protein
LVPGFILDRIRLDEGKELKLCILPERYYKGENFVVEHLEKEGAVFLVNASGESNLARSRNYYIGFQSDKYVMVTVEIEEDTQYVKHFAKDMIKNLHVLRAARMRRCADARPC